MKLTFGTLLLQELWLEESNLEDTHMTCTHTYMHTHTYTHTYTHTHTHTHTHTESDGQSTNPTQKLQCACNCCTSIIVCNTGATGAFKLPYTITFSSCLCCAPCHLGTCIQSSEAVFVCGVFSCRVMEWDSLHDLSGQFA